MTRPLKIDANYFESYADSGKPYREEWELYSGIPDDLEMVMNICKPETIAVLGTATGECLKYIHDKTGIVPVGCEISKHAHSQIPQEYRSYIKNMCLSKYLMTITGDKIDVMFTNSLVYLSKIKLRQVMGMLRWKAKWVHSSSSTLESHCEDPYRRILKPEAWWVEHFTDVNFFQEKRFLFRNMN